VSYHKQNKKRESEKIKEKRKNPQKKNPSHPAKKLPKVQWNLIMCFFLSHT